MMSYISSHLDVLKEKHKHDEVELTLDMFCAKCRNKHPLREFPLDKVEVCGICDLDHNTKDFTSLPRVKAVL